MIAEAALQERGCLGLSLLSGAHMTLVPRIREVMDAHELADVPLILGGIIPERDAPAMHAAGVKGIFGPGTATGDIVTAIRQIVAGRA